MNFKDRLKDIKGPTLVMSGELDVGYTADDVRTTAERIPNAELILFKGYGHNLTFSNNKQIQKDILKFLNFFHHSFKNLTYITVFHSKFQYHLTPSTTF